LKSYVLDASALLCFLQGIGGSDKVAELLDQGQRGNVAVAMSVVNWGEVYYSYHRGMGGEQLEELRQAIRQFPIDIIDADIRLTELAADIKIHHKLAFSDCFAAALAVDRRATLVTSDRDFLRVQGRVRIMWLLSH
jgi:predicted nucleic acid-binding protein